MTVNRKMIKVSSRSAELLKALAKEDKRSQIDYLENKLEKEANNKELLNKDGSLKEKSK